MDSYYLRDSLGINIGDKVKVSAFGGSAGKIGIFVGFKIEYGRGRPVIKKDGTAHATSTIFCYDIKDIKKATTCDTQ